MDEARHETIELALISKGHDLWPAIEAAQYAHVIDHDQPRTEAERSAISAFVTSFTDHVEEWEQRPPEAQSSVLGELGRHLDDLGGQGLFLYWATVEHEITTASGALTRLPIAMMKIARGQQAVLRMPFTTNIERGDG